MREELIALLKEAMVLSDGICRIVGNTQAVAIGHYLFANGVTIPVRCKDCDKFCPEEIRKLYNTDKCCMRTGWVVADDDFCSYGERRTDDRKTG